MGKQYDKPSIIISMDDGGGLSADISTKTLAYSNLSCLAVWASKCIGLPIALQTSLSALLDQIFRGSDGILIHKGREDRRSLSKVADGDHFFRINKRPSYVQGPSEITFSQSRESWNLKIKNPFSLAWI